MLMVTSLKWEMHPVFLEGETQLSALVISKPTVWESSSQRIFMWETQAASSKFGKESRKCNGGKKIKSSRDERQNFVNRFVFATSFKAC